MDTFPRALSTPSRHWPNCLAWRRRAGEVRGNENLTIIRGLLGEKGSALVHTTPPTPSAKWRGKGPREGQWLEPAVAWPFPHGSTQRGCWNFPVNQGHSCMQLNETHMASPPPEGNPSCTGCGMWHEGRSWAGKSWLVSSGHCVAERGFWRRWACSPWSAHIWAMATQQWWAQLS